MREGARVADRNDALVVVPCYNEGDNIRRLVEQILGLGAGLDVLVIDDASPDGTGAIAEELAASHPEVDVLHRPGKLGLGTAYLAGFRHGLDRGYEQVITMDADFSHQPSYLPGLRELGASADLAIGSRYVAGGGASGWPLRRKIVSGTANFLARTVLGISTNDCTAGFRCYSRHALLTVRPESVLSEGYSFLVEMLYRVEKSGLVVREMPIIFVERQAGASKINRAEVYKTLATLGRLRLPGLPWGTISTVGSRIGERSAAAILLSVFALATLIAWRRQ